MDDLISRQAAIEGINKLMEIHFDRKIVLKKARDVVEQLPPAQPEPCEDDPRADVYYLAEKIGIHQLYAFVVQLRGEPEPCEDAVSRAEVLRMIDCINDHHAITPYKSAGAVTEHLTRIARSLPPVTPKQPDCAKCKSELANKIRGQQDNPGMLTENDKGRNWGLEWAAQIVEGKRR